MVIISLYGSNADDQAFYTTLVNKIVEHNIVDAIITGDFNLAIDKHMDRTESVQYRPKALNVVKEMIETMDMGNPWRCRNLSSNFSFSWIKGSKNFF